MEKVTIMEVRKDGGSHADGPLLVAVEVEFDLEITSPYTYLALQAFETHERKQHQLERTEAELKETFRHVPSEDMLAYTLITERIRAQVQQSCRTCGKEA